ncbi:MAG: DUF262 domain-containing protein [Thermoplasmata archaeon]|nr:DUF262 domain-containing protein [Thermoplasmata archaeon]
MDSPQPRAYSVADFAQWKERNELVLAPAFQRRDIWKPIARSFLIDTIVRGFPIPIIFIRQKLNLRARTTVREVVDGQQRIRAVLEFIQDRFTVEKIHNAEIAGITFSNLPDETQTRILSYQFSVVVLESATDADVLNVFSRLNTYQERLNRQELLNAEYTGAFKNCVYELGREHLEFWRSNSILSNRQILRMGEAELVSELVVAMLDGLQDKKKSLKEYYKKYDPSFPEEERVRTEFIQVISDIAKLFGPALKSSPFRKKVLFYSLFLVLYDNRFRLPHSPVDPDRGKASITGSNRAKVLKRLMLLGEQREQSQPDPAYLQFWEASHRQTDNLAPRLTRHRFIWTALDPGVSSNQDS